MKKGVVLVSGSGNFAKLMLDKNRYGQGEFNEFVILCSDKNKLLDLYQLHLGCEIYYVPNFSAVEKVIINQKAELIVFSGYLGKLPKSLEVELEKMFPVYYFAENGNPLYEHGYKGEALKSALKYFKTK